MTREELVDLIGDALMEMGGEEINERIGRDDIEMWLDKRSAKWRRVSRELNAIWQGNGTERLLQGKMPEEVKDEQP